MTLAEKILNLTGPLAELLLADPGAPAADPDNPDPPANVPVIVADAVGEHFFATSPVENWDIRRDFPDLTPRLAGCFVEMGRPTRIYSSTMGVNPSAHLPQRWGWRVDAAGRDDLAVHLARGADAGTLYRTIYERLAAAGLVDVSAVEGALAAPDPYAAGRQLDGPGAAALAAAGIAREFDLLRDPGAAARGEGRLGWLLHAGLVIDDGVEIGGLVATADVALDRGGRVLLPPLVDFLHDQIVIRTGGDPDRVVRDYHKVVTSLLHPALLALSYLNCAGVTLLPRESGRGRARVFVMDAGVVTAPTRN